MKLKTVNDIDLKNKRVLVRVDYNVPISSGIVGDPLRIESSFDTIKYLLDRGCRIVLMSHLGRPDGKIKKELSLAPVAQKTASLLGHPVGFVEDCVGPAAVARAKALKPGEVVLLENLRFHAEEEANDPDFARRLAALGEVYIDDAFAVIHRAHASTVGVTQHLPSVAGMLVCREVKMIMDALHHPDKPLVAVVAGAKVSTKLAVLDNLIKHVDRLVIGGAMANTFLAFRGYSVGRSKQEPELFGEVKRIMEDARDRNVELLLPEDVVVSKSLEAGPIKVVALDQIAKDDYIIDIGPKSIAGILNPLNFHGTIIWNGPLGITEVPAFSHGSLSLANSIIESGAHSVVGGGDTAAFIDEAGLHDKFGWVSTGGGASLELMSGNELPGLTVLKA